MTQQLVFVDLETSGLDPFQHGILELGAIFLDGPDAEPAYMRADVRPDGCVFDERALAVNGFTPERIAAAEPQDRAICAFDARVQKGALLAGWNIPFDMAFLKEAYRASGLVWRFDYHTLDIWSLYYVLKGQGPGTGHLQLKALCKRLGLYKETDGAAHSALQDIDWTWRLYQYAVGVIMPLARPEVA